jgi:hypothetical protein
MKRISRLLLLLVMASLPLAGFAGQTSERATTVGFSGAESPG